MHQKQKKQDWMRSLSNERDEVAFLEWRGVEVDKVVWFESTRVGIERKGCKNVKPKFVRALVFLR